MPRRECKTERTIQCRTGAALAILLAAAGAAQADPKAEAVRAVTDLYRQQGAILADLAHYDADRFFAAYDPDFHETKADGTVKDLAQTRREQQGTVEALHKATVRFTVVTARL